MELSSPPNQVERTGRFAAALTVFGVVIAVLAVIFVLNSLGLFNSFKAGFLPLAGATTITTRDLRFGPEALVVTAGEETTIQLVNEDLYPHSFDVDSLDLHVALGPSATTSFTLTALEPGEYQLYCGIKGHADAGMVGTLIVRPAPAEQALGG